jgi:hypothetical protein
LRSSAPRVSTFRRTPELRPRDGHRVPASRTIVLHHNSSCACRCLARYTSVSPARAHGPALLRPPSTCTHRHLSHVTARTLASPARRHSGSLLHRPRTAPASLGSCAVHASASRLPREQRPHPRLRAPVRAYLRPCACCSCSGRATHARAANRISSALHVREPSCLLMRVCRCQACSSAYAPTCAISTASPPLALTRAVAPTLLASSRARPGPHRTCSLQPVPLAPSHACHAPHATLLLRARAELPPALASSHRCSNLRSPRAPS